MNHIRKEHSIVYLNNFIYAIGGYDEIQNQFLNKCEKYWILNKEWLDCADMNIARCAFCATVVNNKYIFIFGGYDGTQRLARIEKYFHSAISETLKTVFTVLLLQFEIEMFKRLLVLFYIELKKIKLKKV